jgi:diguanylate cyclase (GGDEF)-like protein/PAS domain S-box-containing protein
VAPRLKLYVSQPDGDARPKSALIATAVRRRDAILEAIAESAKELLRSSDLTVSLPKVVERVGPAAGVDRLRIILFRNGGPQSVGREVVGEHYVWSAPDMASAAVLAPGVSIAEAGLGPWAPTFVAGASAVGSARDFDPSVRRFLEARGIKSVLAVPIFVEGAWCGVIGFDNCRSEHDWLPAEIDIVKILAELIGAAIVSMRRLRVLSDANRIVESSPTVVYRLGPKPPFPLIYISQNIRRYGYDAADMMATPDRWTELMHLDDLSAALVNITALVEGKRDHARMEYRQRAADGSEIWFEGDVTALRDEGGHLIALEGVATDITERRRVERALAASHVILTAAIENSPDAILIVDQHAHITTCNRNFADMWKVPQELIAARDDAPVLNLIAARVRNTGAFLARVRAFYANPHSGGQDELETRDGRTIERSSAPLYDGKSQYLGRIWFFRDITERRNAEQTIIDLARTDSLTGLPNRIAFLDRLHLAFARARRGARPFAVLYLDLDHFKDVNDTLGHPAGDALLKVIASRLKSCVRESDMVSRFGGDEFAVLQEDADDLADAETLATKICRTIAGPLWIEGNQIHSSASVGIVPYQGDIDDPEAMLTKADLALYRAKTEGRDRFCFHIRELDDKVRERVTIGEGLHVAVENQEFELHYQPQVELQTGRVIGLEALIRWNHPSRGLLLPGQFIAIAESNGSILQIGQWVIDQVCRQIAEWRRHGIAPPIVAANVSAGQFKLSSNLARMIGEALAKYGVAADQLELELTESVLMEATQRHRDEFERLRHIGVRLAIDDFGTGYSSLDYLRSFRVARLKIDRRFVAGVTTSADDATIVRAVIGLAHALGVEAVAEGVETAEQQAFLISAGCRFAQGYLFGRPMRAAAATALLRRQAGLQADAAAVGPSVAPSTIAPQRRFTRPGP